MIEPSQPPHARHSTTPGSPSTQVLLELLNTPSPTGYTTLAMDIVERELRGMNVTPQHTAKGTLSWTIRGAEPDQQDEVTLMAHIDTLGAMVKEIRPNGRLSLSPLGYYDWATIEGAEAQVHPRRGAPVGGTVVNTVQSIHVHNQDLMNLRRTAETLELRLDTDDESPAGVQATGISVGDFVSFDSCAKLTPSGHIKGRHLDNKAAVAVFLWLTQDLLITPPRCTTHFFISAHEEVGHGAASGLPPGSTELIVVDMAAIGTGQTSSERCVTLCVKDSGGPYDHALSNRLRDTAEAHGIELRVDIYPVYESDGTSAWRSGHPAPVALIGPGIDASHAYERTHLEALEATRALILHYLH